MTTTPHTVDPRPWTIKEGLYSATIYSGSPEFFPLATVTSDLIAAHIVHCVNTYPALLAALKALHQANAETFHGLPNYLDLWDDAAKAIAQAEGRP